MEQNFVSNTINLNNNVNSTIPGGYQQPVYAQPQQPVQVQAPVIEQPAQQPMTYQPVSSGILSAPVETIYTQQPYQPTTTIPQPVVQQTVIQQPVQVQASVQEAAPQVETQPVVQEQPKVEGPQVFDKFMIRTDTLREFISNASKVANCNSIIEISSVILLEFSPNGFKMYATDNNIVLTQRDPSVRYMTEFSIGIDAAKFPKLVSKLTSEYIELVPRPENRTVELYSDENKFILAEKYDNDTGSSPIILENKQQINEAIPEKVDISKLSEMAKRAISLIGQETENSEPGYGSVYCSKYICATNRSSIFGCANSSILSNYEFYLTKSAVGLLASLPFSKETSIGFMKAENGEYLKIFIYDDNTFMSAPLDVLPDTYPLETINNALSTELAERYAVNKTKLYNAIDIAMLFLDGLQDRNGCNFKYDATTKKLHVRNYNGSTNQKVNVVSDSMKSREFNIDISAALRAVNNCDTEDIVIEIHPVDNSYIVIRNNGIIQVLSMVADNQ